MLWLTWLPAALAVDDLDLDLGLGVRDDISVEGAVDTARVTAALVGPMWLLDVSVGASWVRPPSALTVVLLDRANSAGAFDPADGASVTGRQVLGTTRAMFGTHFGMRPPAPGELAVSPSLLGGLEGRLVDRYALGDEVIVHAGRFEGALAVLGGVTLHLDRLALRGSAGVSGLPFADVPLVTAFDLDLFVTL